MRPSRTATWEQISFTKYRCQAVWTRNQEGGRIAAQHTRSDARPSLVIASRVARTKKIQKTFREHNDTQIIFGEHNKAKSETLCFLPSVILSRPTYTHLRGSKLELVETAENERGTRPQTSELTIIYRCTI